MVTLLYSLSEPASKWHFLRTAWTQFIYVLICCGCCHDSLALIIIFFSRSSRMNE
jgi:hypothetical protein